MDLSLSSRLFSSLLPPPFSLLLLPPFSLLSFSPILPSLLLPEKLVKLTAVRLVNSYGPPLVSQLSFTLIQWASDSANHAAWKEIMAANPEVTHDPFDDVEGNFTFGDGALMLTAALSMNKARRLGWTGFVDTRESIFEMYREMNTLGMVPRMKVESARPMV